MIIFRQEVVPRLSWAGSEDNTVRLWDTAPLKTRYQAQRAIEAVRPEAARLVERLLAELHEPAQVVARLRADCVQQAVQRLIWLDPDKTRLVPANQGGKGPATCPTGCLGQRHEEVVVQLAGLRNRLQTHYNEAASFATACTLAPVREQEWTLTMEHVQHSIVMRFIFCERTVLGCDDVGKRSGGTDGLGLRASDLFLAHRRNSPASFACHTWRVLTSSAVSQPPPWQNVSMHLRKPRSKISPAFCGVWPTMATLPEQCGSGIGGRDAQRKAFQFCWDSGRWGS
jgi:hypothetical protein